MCVPVCARSRARDTALHLPWRQRLCELEVLRSLSRPPLPALRLLTQHNATCTRTRTRLLWLSDGSAHVRAGGRVRWPPDALLGHGTLECTAHSQSKYLIVAAAAACGASPRTCARKDRWSHGFSALLAHARTRDTLDGRQFTPGDWKFLMILEGSNHVFEVRINDLESAEVPKYGATPLATVLVLVSLCLCGHC